MKAKLWEFEDLAKRVKDAIYPAVELEKYLESEATGNICYSCIRCIRVSTQANDVPEIECSIFPQVRFAMDECNEYEGW